MVCSCVWSGEGGAGLPVLLGDGKGGADGCGDADEADGESGDRGEGRVLHFGKVGHVFSPEPLFPEPGFS